MAEETETYEFYITVRDSTASHIQCVCAKNPWRCIFKSVMCVNFVLASGCVCCSMFANCQQLSTCKLKKASEDVLDRCLPGKKGCSARRKQS